MIKNTVFKNASHALGVPWGTSSVRPQNQIVGQTYYDTDANKLEYWDGSAWQAISHEGNVTLTKDSFTGDNSKSDFTPMSYSYSAGQEAQVLVHVGTVYQIPGTNYTFYGNAQIHFTSVPSLGATITIIHGLSSTTAA